MKKPFIHILTGDRRPLKIFIQGVPAAGKTQLGKLLATFLHERGHEVRLLDDGVPRDDAHVNVFNDAGAWQIDIETGGEKLFRLKRGTAHKKKRHVTHFEEDL